MAENNRPKPMSAWLQLKFHDIFPKVLSDIYFLKLTILTVIQIGSRLMQIEQGRMKWRNCRLAICVMYP